MFEKWYLSSGGGNVVNLPAPFTDPATASYRAFYGNQEVDLSNHKCINEWGFWSAWGYNKMRRLCRRCKAKEERDIIPEDLKMWYKFNTTICGGQWQGVEDIWSSFSIKDPEVDQVLIAYYSYEDYSGEAFVLYLKDFKLYEVNGSHCSCYGLEGQWEPEEASVDELRQRVIKGRLGRPNYGAKAAFVAELLTEIDLYEQYVQRARRAGFIE